MEGTLAAPNSASLVVVGRRVSPPARVSPESAPADARTLALTMHWTQRGWQTRVDQCEGPVWVKSCAISASHLATACQKPPTPVSGMEAATSLALQLPSHSSQT